MKGNHGWTRMNTDSEQDADLHGSARILFKQDVASLTSAALENVPGESRLFTVDLQDMVQETPSRI
jgi:hypothetical protein